MIVFSITYILAAIAFYHCNLGDASLVYANIINLCARIVYCLIFIKRYFRTSDSSASPFIQFRFYDALPSWQLWTASAFSAVLIYASEQWFEANTIALQLGRQALMDYRVILHIFVGTSLAFACLMTWWITASYRLNIPIRRKTE